MMSRNRITVSVALSTTLLAEKAERIADECGVRLTLIDTRLRKDRKWLNDFEVEGAPGKVDNFVARIKDLEVN